MHKKYADAGLAVVTINAWDESEFVVTKFARDKGLEYTVLLNGNETFSGPYKGRSVPQTYLIDRAGKISYAHLGWDSGDQKNLAQKIEELLAERP